MISEFVIAAGSKMLSKCLTQYIKYKLSTDCIEKEIIVATTGILSDEGFNSIAKKIKNKLLYKPTLHKRYADVCSSVFNELMSQINYTKYLKEWYEAVTTEKNENTGDDLKESLTEWFSHHKALTPNPEVIIDSFVSSFNEKLSNRIQQDSELFQYFDTIKKDKSLEEILERIDCVSTKLDNIKDLHEKTLTEIHEIKEGQADSEKNIEKKKYLSVHDMIPRKIIPYEYIQDSFTPLHKQYALTLLEYCKKERHIVLLGDAAAGKTIALKDLAYRAYDSEYYPCFISLSDYTGETIEEMINRECGFDPNNSYILIFDAYDETRTDDRDVFARKINVYSDKRKNDIIVISVRHNFYHYNNSSSGGSTFKNFKEFGLYPLYQKEITNYLTQNGVDLKRFYKQLHERNLTSLMTNPFYLSGMSSLFKKNSSLPSQKELMIEMIRNSFDLDKIKFTNPHKVVENEYELMALLKQVAIAMQLMEKKVSITNNDFSAIFDNKKRNLIKYSSLFSKSYDETWSFQHNNFREFLAAEYLNELPIDEIKYIICSDKEHTKIRSSWLNVLSYLALINEDSKLLEWVIDTSPELVVKFEKSRVKETKRAAIFIDIFKHYTERNMYIYQGVNEVEKLVDFGECTETLEYLINILKTSDSKWNLKSATITLSHFKRLFSKEEEIRGVLLSIIKNDSDELVQISAVDAIASLKLNTDETTIAVNNLLDKNNSIYIAEAIVRYIDNCGLQDEQLERLISINNGSYNTSEEYNILCTRISQAFANVEESDSVKKILTYMIDLKQSYYYKEKLKTLIDKAICFYKEGDTSYYDYLFSLLLKAIKNSNEDYINILDCFFHSTDTNDKLYNDLIDYYTKKAANMYYLWLYINVSDNKSCIITELMKRYIKEPDKYQDFIIFFEENKDVELYTECYALMKKRGDINKITQRTDYDSIKQQALQEYVNSLFNKELYLENIKKLLKSIGDENITCNDILDTFFKNCKRITYEYELNIRYVRIVDIHNCDTKVIDFISGINDWIHFCVSCVMELLSSKENVSFNEEQITIIRDYCNSVDIDDMVENGFAESSPMEIRFRHETEFFCFLSQYFCFDYPKDVFLKLTAVPSIFFGNEQCNKNLSQYIQDKIEKDDLIECVRYNLNNRKLCTYSMVEHIEFCMENDLDFALSKAEELCLTEGVFSGYKTTALEYIIKIKNDDSNNYEYIYDRFLDTEDEDLIEALITLTADNAAPRFMQRLEELNEQDEDKSKYLRTLIKILNVTNGYATILQTK